MNFMNTKLSFGTTASLLVASLCAVSAADWPQFRGPAGDGVAPDTKLPTSLDTGSVAWSANLPGRGISSPVIVGNRVFVTASSGARQDRLHVMCYNLVDGVLLWERQFWATGRTQTH